MASGINFNPASRQVSGGNLNRAQQTQETVTPNPVDGFQPGHHEVIAQPMAAGQPGSVDFTVTPEQLASSAFRNTLATLASQGIHVNIVMANAAGAQPQAPSGEVTRPEFQGLQNQVTTLEHRVDHITAPKPAPPTYGGD